MLTEGKCSLCLENILAFTSYFQESFLSFVLAFVYPCAFAVCSIYGFAEGMAVSTMSAVFALTVPSHSGCFIHKTRTSSPLSDACLLSFSLNENTLTYSLWQSKYNADRVKSWNTTLLFLYFCFPLHSILSV